MVVAAGTEKWALFFHLLGAFLLVSGVVLAGVAFEAARRRRAAAEVALLLGLTRAGVALLAVGLPLALGFGLWLVHIEGIGYGRGWVGAAIVLFVAMLVLGALGGRRPRQARILARALADGGAPVNDDLRSLLDDAATRAANYCSAAIALVILVLMVFKP